MKPRLNRLAALIGSVLVSSLAASGQLSAAGEPPSPPPAPTPTADSPPPQQADPTPAATPPSTPPPAAPAAAPTPDPKPVAGQDVEIVFADGRSTEGRFVEQDSHGTTVILGGHTQHIPKALLAGVRPLPPLLQRFDALRAATAEDDIEGIMQLAEWIRARGRLDLALVEVERVLTLQRNNPDALQLRTVILEQARLEKLREQRGELPAGPPAGKPLTSPQTKPKPTKATARPTKPGAFPVLSPEEINVIRVFEVDLADPPKMLIKRETIDRFLSAYAGKSVPGRGTVPSTPEGRMQFIHQTPAQILAWFFDLQAREFYNDVQVPEDPKAFRLFRENVNRTWLTNRCATDRCHGGAQAGRLFLTNDKPASVEAAYTNFYILDRFRTRDGRALISYAEPANSPLLQMGLPKERSKLPHPEVAGLEHWDTPFKSDQDERFLRAVEWIRAMYPRRTEYPVAYVPPDPTKLPPPPAAANPKEQLTPPGVIPDTPPAAPEGTDQTNPSGPNPAPASSPPALPLPTQRPANAPR